MKQRGRQSANEVATIVVDAGTRMPPPAPSELTDAQADVWRDVVGSVPGNWFSRATYPVLVAYCRHVCRARLLEMQIAKFEPEWTKVEGGLERLNKLLGMAERETRAVTACGRALRLTPSSQMQPITAGRAINAMSRGPRLLNDDCGSSRSRLTASVARDKRPGRVVIQRPSGLLGG